ncbi:hypothetical protein MLD38_037449 [Melastoma candidum]|uniref:Uncharacterized protein n=1 Tax=Melastoma candidum TaxID=119954 RepID=A0ACB9LMQ4_9MYRT|nr:hypothetical protein MLD38_037449 [Melastoma candidum]
MFDLEVNDKSANINSSLEVLEHREALRTSNALEILSNYDIVVDAIDNAPSRYMINDCCIVSGKLTVYNYKGGPCYRCLFPTPPPTTACQRCSDSGVLGDIYCLYTGVIGCLQVKIRGKCLQCEACGENSEFSRQYFKDFDYEKFTQSPMSTSAPVKLNLLGNDSRITTKDYNKRLSEVSSAMEQARTRKADVEGERPNLYVICRSGNDS